MFVVWWEKEKRKRKNSRRRTKNLGIKNEEYGFVFFVLSSSSRATDISIRSSIRSNSETKTNREE
jgi:hypothetical protein|tara:strand:- start:63 stop:257 length:195 start_codon:yes stop_codon:yes gene_type:complete